MGGLIVEHADYERQLFSAPRFPDPGGIPILLIRLGLKRLDSWLAIMGFEDRESVEY
jgi:hypothetical protein